MTHETYTALTPGFHPAVPGTCPYSLGSCVFNATLKQRYNQGVDNSPNRTMSTETSAHLLSRTSYRLRVACLTDDRLPVTMIIADEVLMTSYQAHAERRARQRSTAMLWFTRSDKVEKGLDDVVQAGRAGVEKCTENPGDHLHFLPLRLAKLSLHFSQLIHFPLLERVFVNSCRGRA